MARRFRGPYGAEFTWGEPLPTYLVDWLASGEVAEIDGPSVEPPKPPPTHGAGSGRAAWVAYAGKAGIRVTDEMSRGDIVAAIENKE